MEEEEECSEERSTGVAPSEWQGRLEELQLRHKEESTEQQRLHLAQLLQLQDILLNELATQCSGKEPLDEAVKKEVLLSLGLNHAEREEEEDASLLPSSVVSQEQPHAAFHVQCTGSHFEHGSRSSSAPLSSSPGEKMMKDTQLPPLSQNVGVPLLDQRPSSSQSIASTEYLELPGTSHALSPSEIPLSYPPCGHESPAGPEVAISDTATYNTPRQFLSEVPHPDSSNWRTGSHDRNISRSTLMEKHARHVEDLQNYYETQLTSLQHQLSSLKLSAHRGRSLTSSSSSPTKNSSPTGKLTFSPAKERGHDCHGRHQEWPASEVLVKENQRLRNRCAGLEQQLEDLHK